MALCALLMCIQKTLFVVGVFAAEREDSLVSKCCISLSLDSTVYLRLEICLT